MGLIREPLNIDLAVNSNATPADLEKIDAMIQKLKSKNKTPQHTFDSKRVRA
jgi:hypothetical protein